MVSIRSQPDDGLIWVFVVFAITWGARTPSVMSLGDSLARRKLAPIISPNKTVEGAIGGYLGRLGLGSPATDLY